jgi:DNA-directed RNA polymerase specialized sigma24 family protein
VIGPSARHSDLGETLMETSSRDGGIDRRVMNNIRFHAHRLARGQTVPGMAVEDYEQDLVLDLLRRRKAFNPELASFATFADRVVSHRISALASSTLRLIEERRAVSLDATARDEDGSELTLLDLLPDEAPPIDESAAIRIDVGRLVAGLPPPLLDCCAVLLADSISEGARAAQIHRSTAYERAARLRERALAQGLAIYVTGSPDTFACPPVDDEDQPGRSPPASDFDQEGHSIMNARSKFPTVHLALSEIDLCGWLGQAEPGDTLEYYRGFLAVDAIPGGSRLPERDRVELGRIARRALWASERGLAHLLQRRHGPDDYSYIIVARPRSPSQSLSELLAAEVV